MISVYKRLGHETSFVGAWTGDAFFLATILFVDDPDLLNMDIGTSTDEIFLKTVQEAILDWGGLVQATGGSLKSSKCFWYMMAWYWVQCQPCLKYILKLPADQVKIP